jgi:hypothetical protein
VRSWWPSTATGPEGNQQTVAHHHATTLAKQRMVQIDPDPTVTVQHRCGGACPLWAVC